MFPTNVAEKIKTHFMLKSVFFENLAVCEIMWKTLIELGRPQMTTKYDAEKKGNPCWKAKFADTQSEYMILIAFPWHKRLRESA